KALEAFRHEGKQMAFVVDEFGTLEGIVSLTDIMEAIAGELPEAEQGMDLPPSVVALEPGRYEVDASENLEEINRQLPEPLPRSPLYTTLAGLILNHLEHMPEKDELLTVDGWQMRILEIEHMRIARVELTRQDLAEARSRDWARPGPGVAAQQPWRPACGRGCCGNDFPICTTPAPHAPAPHAPRL